jgi:lambda repressor-like predicted transcriptional regulator
LKGKKKPEGFGNQVRERLLDKAQPYSVKDNMSKAHTGSNNSRAKLNEEQVYQIKLKLMEGKTIKQLSEEHGVSRDAITDIRREESWTVVQVPGFNEWASRTIKRRKLDYDSVEAHRARQIKIALKQDGASMAKIARDFNVSFDVVHYIAKGKTWSHITID